MCGRATRRTRCGAPSGRRIHQGCLAILPLVGTAFWRLLSGRRPGAPEVAALGISLLYLAIQFDTCTASCYCLAIHGLFPCRAEMCPSQFWKGSTTQLCQQNLYKLSSDLISAGCRPALRLAYPGGSFSPNRGWAIWAVFVPCLSTFRTSALLRPHTAFLGLSQWLEKDTG